MKNDDVIQNIKSRLRLSDIVRRYVDLRPAGVRLVAPCPFHQETKPSFTVNDEQGVFHCFGCQVSGDIFDFYGRINGLNFRETLQALADEAGIRLESWKPDPKARQERSQKTDMLRMHELSAAHFRSNLTLKDAAACREYILQRGISPELQERFGIGWSMDSWQDLCDTLRRSGYDLQAAAACGLLSKNSSGRLFDRFRSRLMFPIRSLSGQVVAFGGRILPSLAKENDAKYINSSDSPIYKKGEHLFGLFQARPAITSQKSVILTEGYMDVVTLHQYGYTQATAALGTMLTPDQIRRLSGLTPNVELMMDGDAPGRKAAFRTCEMLLARGLSCKVVLFPDDNDIDSMLHSFGRDAVEALRSQAQDGMDFCISFLRGMAPREIVEWSRNFLSSIEMPELFNRFAVRLAGGTGMSEAELRSGIQERKKPFFTQAPSVQPKSISRDREIMTFAVRYPGRIPDLLNDGADFALTAPWSRKLWEKLAQFGENAFDYLDPKEKNFWIRCRSAGAPPLDNEQAEFDAIRKMLNHELLNLQTASMKIALQQGTADAGVQREYMVALKEARGRHRDQQS